MAVKVKNIDTYVGPLREDTSFGDLDDRQNDPSTWRIAMASHANLFMTRARGPFKDQRMYRKLAPLGSYTQIVEFIDGLLDTARDRNGGTLPAVYYVEANIPGNPDIMIPVQGLSTTAQITIEEALQSGTTAIQRISSIIESSGQAARRVNQAETIIREELAASPDWQDATDEEIEEEVVDRLREFSDAEWDDEADVVARGILSDLLSERYPGSDEIQINEQILELENQAQRQGRGTDMESMTSAQRVSAIATTASSLTAGVIEMANTDYELAADLAADILTYIGEACMSIGGLVGGEAGAVLIVIGVIVMIIGAIVRALREYTVKPEEGVNREWSRRDLRLIMQDRLRVLCQCEEHVSDNFGDYFRAVYGAETESTRWEILKNMVYQTARDRGYPDRVDAARAICVILGGTDESMRKIDDIKSWLIYAGVKEEDAQLVWNWLYDARRTTEIVKRHDYVASSGRQGQDYTGYSKSWMNDNAAWCKTSSCRNRGQWRGGRDYQAPCDDYDIGPADPPGSGTFNRSAEPNMWRGSSRWFYACQGLDVGGEGTPGTQGVDWRLSPEFVNFSMTQLKEVYKHVARRLAIRLPGMDRPNLAPPSAQPRFELTESDVLGPDDSVLAGVLALQNTMAFNVGGANVVCTPSLGALDLVVALGSYELQPTFTLNINGWSWRCWARVPLSSSLIQEVEAESDRRGGGQFINVINEYVRSSRFRQLVVDEITRYGGAGSTGPSAGAVVVGGAAIGLGIYALSKLL